MLICVVFFVVIVLIWNGVCYGFIYVWLVLVVVELLVLLEGIGFFIVYGC